MERFHSPMRARDRAIDVIVLLAIALLLALAIVEVLASRASAGETARNEVTPPWAPHLQRMDEALEQMNVSVALRAWNIAYAAALGSRRWEGMLDVGDAYLRIGDRLGHRRAFAALDDRQVVAQCLKIAQDIAGRDENAQARVQAYASRFADPSITAGRLRIEP